MKHLTTFFSIIYLSFAVIGCSGADTTEEQTRKPNTKKETQTTDSKQPENSPAKYTVKLETTKGDILIDVEQKWSPHAAKRFYELVTSGYYTDIAFFRVIDGFMAQAGISGDPGMNKKWRTKGIPDDPVKISNKKGMVTFAMSGRPNSRTTQFFINFTDNEQLDKMRFAPFGKVKDMTTVNKLYKGYGEGAPRGKGPSQARLHREGNEYLKKEFPKLDYIIKATVL